MITYGNFYTLPIEVSASCGFGGVGASGTSSASVEVLLKDGISSQILKDV